MNVPRPARIWAVLRYDLALQLGGGLRGVFLPAMLAGLLIPTSVIVPPERAAKIDRPPAIVGGPGAPELEGAPGVRVVPEGQGAWIVVGRPAPDQPMHAIGRYMPEEVRAALDAKEPGPVAFEDVRIEIRLPDRSLALALISASVLVGALSESIPGERSRKTLEAMLTAGITRTELIVGKWAAWAGLGAMASLLATIVALLRGTLHLGWWMIPLPFVPMCTVALGLFLVRRATDVVGGATISMRVLPALLSILAFFAWTAGWSHPYLGAIIPLGGALIAAGNLWDGAGPALVAAASSLIATGTALYLTIRDLETDNNQRGWLVGGTRIVATTAGLGALGWWISLAGPLLWAMGGNREVAEKLPLHYGVTSGALLLSLLLAVELGRADDPFAASGWVAKRPNLPSWLGYGLLGAIVLVLASGAGGLIPMPETIALASARIRFASGIAPGWAGLGLMSLAVVVQETLFRGVVQRAAGPILATLAWAAVMSPLDPLTGLISGGILSAITWRTGSVYAALIAHVGWALAWGATPPLPPIVAAAVGAMAVAGLALTPRPEE